MSTPKTLSQAIDNALWNSGICKEESLTMKVKVVRSHVKDFVAQKFTTYMLAHPGEEDMLRDLFAEITKEDV